MSIRARPLAFSDPMVLAIKREIEKSDTGKTQTRRVLRATVPPPPAPDNVVRPPKHPAPYLDAYCDQPRTPWNPRGMGDHWCWWTRDDRPCSQFKVGYRPGDLIWVKETYAYLNDQVTIYRADWQDDARARGLDNVPGTDEGIRWRPPRFMPRCDSRFVLVVTDVRVQQLQDITAEDALAEGVTKVRDHCYVIRGFGYDLSGLCHSSPIVPFAHLWDSLSGKRKGCSWEDNPWVVALTFHPFAINIERYLAWLAA